MLLCVVGFSNFGRIAVISSLQLDILRRGLGLLDSEGTGIRTLWNVSNALPIDRT